MKTTRNLVLMACFVLLAAPAGADRPECPPTKPGACFLDISNMGQFGFLVDPDDDTVIVGPFDENNDFIRFPARGERIRLHQIDRDIDLYACLGDPGCGVGGFTHVGIGHVSANVSFTPRGDLSCPTSIQVHGTAIGPAGGEFDVRAALIVTPSRKSPTGCRVVLGDVSITPK